MYTKRRLKIIYKILECHLIQFGRMLTNPAFHEEVVSIIVIKTEIILKSFKFGPILNRHGSLSGNKIITWDFMKFLFKFLKA